MSTPPSRSMSWEDSFNSLSLLQIVDQQNKIQGSLAQRMLEEREQQKNLTQE